MIKVLEWIEKGIYFVGTLFLLAICFSVNLQIVTRTFFNNALTWPEEVSQFLLIGLIFLGTGLVEKKNAQIKVEFIYTQFPKLSRFLLVIGKVFVAIYIAGLLLSEKQLYPSIVLLKSKAAQIPLYWIHITVIFGCFVWLTFSLYSLVKVIFAPKEDIQC